MKIEYNYTSQNVVHIALDAAALRILEHSLLEALKGAELDRQEIVEICLSISEIVKALDRLAEEAQDKEKEERIVHCGECVFSEEEDGGIACTRTKDGIIRCELDYCSMGHLHGEDEE